jgi:anhydro-N-acetylmuramic acid kinase
VPANLYVGIMSGTSLDGIDTALVDFGEKSLQCLASHYTPYGDELRDAALALQESGTDELRRAADLANRLGRGYAAAVTALLADAGVPAAAVRAIGCHGQTVRHAPDQGYSIQLNNPAMLAELTGITVVADFRSRDLAAGGQGAPLVPAFHDLQFRRPDRHRIILNIGGIANLTDLAPGRPTSGFDCGPGNMLMDAWAYRHLGIPYDQDGRLALAGSVIPQLLARLMEHPYLAAPPPKSCGREQFNLPWLLAQLAGGETPADVQATLVEFTAAASANAIRHWCGQPLELYVCGGGASNPALMTALHRRLAGCHVGTTVELGLAPDWVEAVAFAWLARCALDRQPGNLPSVTGARGPRILGAIHPA